jgi:SPX domain protein involved in polyphosphate accumulation
MEDSEEEIYETELAQLFTEEDEVHVFFARLDEELNKVNQFYRKQEVEFLERGDMLSKQLQILLDLKQLVTDRLRKNNLPPRSSNAEIFSRSPDQSSNYLG